MNPHFFTAFFTLFSFGSGFKVQGSRFRVQGSGFKVQGLGFRVQGSGFKVQGSRFRVHGSRGGFAAFFAEGAAGAGRKGEISAACRTLP